MEHEEEEEEEEGEGGEGGAGRMKKFSWVNTSCQLCLLN